MKTVLTIALIFLNIFSILMSLKMLKGFEKAKIIISIALGEIILFTICNIIYALTSGGIPQDVHQASRFMIIFTMLPINMMVVFCPIASLINKRFFDEISEEDLKKKIIVVGIIALAILVFEMFYIKNIQLGIINIVNK